MSEKNYNERIILLETAKIIIAQFQSENKNVFDSQDFICKLTNEKYPPSREHNYNGQWGGFLSANEKELSIKKTAEAERKKKSPMEWEIISKGVEE